MRNADARRVHRDAVLKRRVRYCGIGVARHTGTWHPGGDPLSQWEFDESQLIQAQCLLPWHHPGDCAWAREGWEMCVAPARSGA